MNRFFLLLCLLVFQQAVAQNFRSERIFLSPDKETCALGDTLRVKGQVFSSDESVFYPYSRYLYLECINREDSVLLRQKIACDRRGYFQTALLTNVDWTPGVYYLRAYTRWMQNFSEESFPVTPFLLGTAHPVKEEPAREVHARLFPEGGRLLNGFLQNVVFQLTDNDGFPVADACSFLLDEKNDTLVRAASLPVPGCGKFSFHPEAGKQYRLLSLYHDAWHSFPMPVQAEGATLQAVAGRGRLSCRILSREGGERFRLFLYHVQKGLLEIPFPAAEKTAVLDVSGYPEGMLALFLTDRGLNKVAERVLWLDGETDTPEVPKATCNVPQTAFAPGRALAYALDVPDSSSVFVRVVRKDNLAANQVYAACHWGGDVSTPVRFPLLDNPSAKELQAVRNDWLMTASFVLFRPEAVLKGGMAYPYLIEDGLFLTGKAWKEKGKPFGPGFIDVMNKQAGIFYTGKIEQDGSFTVPVDDYPVNAPFLLTAKNLKGKTADCFFTMRKDSFPKVVIPHPVFLRPRVQTDVAWGDSTLRYSMDENEQKVYHMDGVEVKARKAVDIKEISRMSSNYIGEKELRKWPAKSVRTLLNKFTSIKIAEGGEGSGAGILRKSIIGKRAMENPMQIYNDGNGAQGSEPTIIWRNKSKYDFMMGSAGVLNVVVNGELVFSNIDYILGWSAGDIRSIELIRPNDPRAALYGTPYGAVAIETVREVHLNQDEPKGKIVRPFGLTVWEEQEDTSVSAPSLPGEYLLLIDVVTTDKQMVSFCKGFEVQ